MRIKFSLCPCSHPRPRRQPFKFSTAQSGHKTKPSNRVWPRNPLASDVKKLKLWNTSFMDVRTTRQRYGLWLAKFSLSPSQDILETLTLRIDLTPLEIVFNKPHPSILLHVPDGTTRKILQEIKRDIIFRRAQLAEPRRREELPPRIQAHLLSVISKLQSFLEYQGVLNYTDALALLRRMAHSTLHD
jgi:hypothetical protein